MSAKGSNDKKEGMEEPLSRDEVKAQREAKRVERAARKNKSLGKPEDIKSPTAAAAAAALPAAKVKAKQKETGGGGGKKKQDKEGEGEAAVAAPSETAPAPPPIASASSIKDNAQDNSNVNVNVKTKEEEETSNQSKNTAAVPVEASAGVTLPKDEEGPTKVISHLTKKQQLALKKKEEFEAASEGVHHLFKELGLRYQSYNVHGSNSRTKALLQCIKAYIDDYITPDGKDFKQDISAQLHLSLEYLKLHRPFAVGMSTAVDGLYGAIRSLGDDLPEADYKEELFYWCDQFMEEKITKAVEAIGRRGNDKINEGDTILLYSITEPILHTLKLAAAQGKKFNLILAITKKKTKAKKSKFKKPGNGSVDENGNNYLRDYKLLRDAMGLDLPERRKKITFICINISSVMSFMSTVDKVFLGGHALFTTGGVMAHAGSSSLALCAAHHNIPSIFFCEIYKCCDKSPTDAFYSDVFLENKFFGDSSSEDEDEEKVGKEDVAPRKSKTPPRLPQSSRITYDVTPVSLVTCVVTDIDMLPSSSVPVVLRVQETRPLKRA